jgi:3-oxoacyl-[acyl-carrier protein] reductase
VQLEGRVALVTGASRGIGAAVCRRYAAEGAAVAVHHHPDPGMTALAHELAAALVADGARAMAVPADLTRPEEVAAAVAAVEGELGAVDLLVANAARTARGAWHQIDLAEWDAVHAVNLRGTFLCCRAVYPEMRRRGYGRIITVSSVLVEAGGVGVLAYVTSKAGLVGFTRALAREVGPDGITVNCVLPGSIRTEAEEERFAGQEEEIARRATARQAIPRRGLPGDLEGAFVFLASRDSDFVTGQTLVVDGGWVHR